MTDSANVAAFPDEEDVGANVPLLGSSLQAAALGSETFEINVIRNLDDKVDVLRVGALGADGAYQADSLHTFDLPGEPDELLAGIQ